MKRLLLALLTLGVLAAPATPAAHAAPEAGTLEMAGLITYTTSAGTSSIAFFAVPCVHTAVPDSEDLLGWFCDRSFLLYDSTATGTNFTLKGQWRSGSRTYAMSLSLPDLLMVAGPHAATGTFTQGTRSGPATFTFVTAPHADSGKASFVGAIEYVLPG